ncbi:MAG: type II secretion system F family protein [Chloroflexi bacterium]|nr:type II secretion system F family protein [Chloroflexota bacterium]
MQFRYVAYLPERGVFKDTIAAPDQNEAAAAVASLGYRLLKIAPVRGVPGLEAMFPSMFKAGTGDLVRFFQQVASMLGSGGNLLRALEMAGSESKSRVMRRVIGEMRTNLADGESLSQVMHRYPAVFSELHLSIVEAGESTGRLGPSLEQLADMLAGDAEAKSRAMKTMMYPMTIIGMSFATLGVLMTVAVPPLLKVFEQMGAGSPAAMTATIAAIGFVKENLLMILGAGAATVLGLAGLRRVPGAAGVIDGVSARLPLLGPLSIAGDMARFSRTVGMLLEAGVPLSDALPKGIGGCSNVRVKEAMRAGEESLLAGRGFASELRRHRVLPSLFLELISMGEDGNQMARMMNDAAVTYQKEREARLGSLLAALEPASTVVVGGIVAFIAFSMFVPIYSGLDALR